MKIYFYLILYVFISSAHAQDSKATPGMINPAVTQANINKTICKAGWTATIRPSASYTNALKKKQLASGPYKSSKPLSYFEEDHRVPLEVGGHPTSEKNLWPQPWTGSAGAHAKDLLENATHRDVCSGKITLAAGQQRFLASTLQQQTK